VAAHRRGEVRRERDRARRELERLESSGQQLAQKHQAYITTLRALVDRQKAELEARASSAALTFGKVAGTIAPADQAQTRKSSPKWIKSIVEE
jgi:hypothetical protein